MAEIVIVTGTPGAGKTTVLKALKAHPKYSVIEVGSLMQDLSIEKGYTKDRDQMRYLPLEKQTELRALAFKKINSMEGKVLVDTHASIMRKGRLVPGLPLSAMKTLKNIKALIHIDATVKEILLRRSSDNSRAREVQPESEIENQHTFNLSVMAYYASYLNIPLYIIANGQGSPENASMELSAELKEVFGEQE